MTIGYEALAADLYWIRAIQYYGGLKRRFDTSAVALDPGAVVPDEYRLLYPLLDLTTTLDPRFNIAYRFGSIFLAEPYPGGAGRPDLAIALLEKGLQERPDKWEYMQDIGYVHYWWRQDYPEAARWFERAGSVPGAPWFLRSLAATTLTEGGNRESSRTMWRAIRETAEIEWLRNDADRRLQQLDVLDFIDELQSAVDRFAEVTGERPSDWSALIRARVIPGVPTDPAATPYELDPKGRVRLSSKSPLYPLPNEPRRLGPPS
jgi:tetratricopeptide (TPR) repeat protein